METNSEKQVLDLRQYNRDGYYVLKGFFHPNDVRIVSHEAKCVFRKQTANLDICSLTELSGMVELFKNYPNIFANCGKTAQHGINLWKLSLQDRVISVLHQAGLQHPVVCTRPVVYFNHPSLATERVYHTVDAHQDWRSMQGSSNAAVLWVPLVNCDKELGALQVLPGSHKNGLRTTSVDKGFGMVSLSNEEKSQLVSLECNVGDAVLFHSMLVHQSGTNSTDRIRWSCHFRYNDIEDQGFIDRGYVHPYVYKPVEELL